MAVRRFTIIASENSIQKAVMQHWAALGLPDTLVACIPNANAHGQPGLTAGLPDLLVMGPNLPGGAKTAFVELKRDPRARVSKAQQDFASLCARLGQLYAIAYGRDEPIRLLEDWNIVAKSAA